MRKLFILALFLIFAVTLFSQTGVISGKVINASSGQGLVNATLSIIENGKVQLADQNGSFSFSKIPAGTYSIKCSYSGHVDKIVEEIVVKNDENTVITISLDEIRSDAVVITAKTSARRETVASLLVARKNMANVSDFISAEQISKTPDRSTGDVIKRISGATIQDEKFAIIRGLNDRYNAAFINGAPLPSTESDRKAFAFDIFPSVILDNLIIYKTATPDKSGEFAGGLIDITTKSILTKSFTSISFGASYNTILTGKNRFYSENIGKKDWIGIDNGRRGIPHGIPSSGIIKSLAATGQRAQLADLAKLFGNYKWGILSGNTKPNYNFQLSRGFNIKKNGNDFVGVLLSANYNRNYTFNTGERNDFQQYDFSVPYYPPVQIGKFIDSIYNDEVVVAGLANFSININSKNKVSWKNNMSINSDNKLVKRFGAPDAADETFFNRESLRIFTSNKIYTSQLEGQHTVSNLKTKINWLAGFSKVDRDIPNLSRITYVGRLPDVNSISASFANPLVQTSGSGTMFFSESDENIKSLKADIIKSYSFMKNSQNFISIGGGYQIRERDFASRFLGFAEYSGGGVMFDQSLNSLPEDQIFLDEHLGLLKNGKGGYLLVDGTLPNSDYTASSRITHGYIMNDQRFFEKIRVIYGVRMERFNQRLYAIQGILDTVNLNSTVSDFLPSVNFVYAITSKTNFRLSYATSVNRPEFRELAPFLFFDNVSKYNISGRPTLVRAKIHNYDLRYEFFPGRAQLFSISAFYKDFINPIEFVTLPNTTSQAVYNNSTSAKLFGAEIEFRTLLSTLLGIKSEKSIFDKITWSANGAYMKSSVKLVDLFGLPQDQLVTDRNLQGQSPYIINTSILFNDEKSGFSSAFSLNRFGDRVAIAGTYNIPDIYEKGRTVIDFQLSKYFLEGALELKINARDILSQNLNFYFDFDKSRSFSDNDRFFSNYKAPKVFSLSATLKF